MHDELNDERAELASELALGVLEGDDRAKALRLYLRDPEFAKEVDQWQLRLGLLLEKVENDEPPAGVWQAIETRLSAEQPTKTFSALSLWRGTAVAATAVAAALALALFAPHTINQVQPSQMPSERWAVASLKGDSGAILAANYTVTSSEMRIRSVDVRSGKKVPELWIIPKDGIPKSLGLISPTGTTKIAVPASLRAYLTDGSILAVSLETQEDAPHKAPSSAPIATGIVSLI